MRIKKQWILGGVALWLVLFFLLVAQFFYFASHPLAPWTIRNHVETPSPNGTFIIDVFDVYGDATSTDLTQVLIRRRDERFEWRNGHCIFSVEGLKKTEVKWVSDSQLHIQYESGIVYQSIPEWEGVNVSYSQLK